MLQGFKSKLEFAGVKGADNENINVKDKLNFDYLIGSLKNIIVFIICALVSSCKLTSGAIPFGIAILGAVNTMGIPLIIPFLLVSVVTGICFGGIGALKVIIASLVYVAIKAFIKTEDTKVR